MKKTKALLITGLIILLVLIISYFIKINVDSGYDYIIQDSLLGIAIFHNIYVLILYILIALFLTLPSILEYFKLKRKK